MDDVDPGSSFTLILQRWAERSGDTDSAQ
jgi:hypothetical protein